MGGHCTGRVQAVLGTPAHRLNPCAVAPDEKIEKLGKKQPKSNKTDRKRKKQIERSERYERGPHALAQVQMSPAQTQGQETPTQSLLNQPPRLWLLSRLISLLSSALFEKHSI